MSKKKRIILTISLILNVLFMGIIGGHIIRWSSHHNQRHEILAGVVEKLPEDKRAMVKAELKQVHDADATRRAEIEKARDELMKSLTALEFDTQRYDAASAKLHRLHGEMGSDMAKAIKHIAVNLSQEERKILAESLQRHRPPHKREKH